MKLEEDTNILRNRILLKTGDTENLPVIPQIAMDIMSYVDDEKTSMKQISDIISNDPSLSAQILKVANSAFYGLSKHVGSLELALIILGLREIKNIIFMMSVFKLFPHDIKFSFNKIDFMKHSILTAQTMKLLAGRFKINFESSPFLAGLLHDIGKIFLDQHFHQQYMKVIKEVNKNKKFMYQAEAEVLGTDHAEVGAALATRWDFPEDIQESIKYHHEVGAAKKHRLLTSVVHIADVMANARNAGLPYPSRGISITDDEGWKILFKKKPGLKEFDVERILFEIDEELKKSEEIIQIYSSKLAY
ncbi:MAG: HDOD domain-containing protein [Actinobacteria bacterium]|nr:HDOD domain-containing protein [Actinomycetota bacterium]